MCGIYASSKIKEMGEIQIDKQYHRGPDFQSIKLIDNKIIFGHNRLAIIDLDSRANQPMSYNDNWITFNGEIYNFLDLKSELKTHKYKFTTSSDTEVLLAAYHFWGQDFVQKLEGMFAFVIYDAKKQILFGARDRLGQKPFFYNKSDDQIEIASMGSLLKKSNKLEIDEVALNKYLLFGYVPEPYSIYKNVKKLPAGHVMNYSLIDKQLEIRKYWDINYDKVGTYKRSFIDAKKDLNNLLIKSVNDRLISDVPLGVFLSGGIDSSIITAIAQKISNNKIKTFSIKFEEEEFDESKYAKQVANFLGTDHKEITCTYDESKEFVYNFSDYYDEPFDDSSAIPSMLLAKHTKKEVSVALTGDGGDENFIGYERYFRTNTFCKYIENYPNLLRPMSTKILQLTNNNTALNLSKWMQFDNLKDFYLYQMTGGAKKWLNYDSKNIDNRYDNILQSKKLGEVEKVAFYDLKTYLIDDINAKVDQASMAFSLETRSPLLNFKIVEFASQLPLEYKVSKKNKGKYILKELLYDYLPKEYFERKKSGFAIPLNEWFRKELKVYVYDVLKDENLAKIKQIKAATIKQMIDDHMNGKADYSRIIWRLICLIRWMEKHE